MFALLIPILAQLPGLIGKFFQQKNEILTATNEAARQIELAKINMAHDIAVAQMNLNATIIQATSPGFKYFTFFMWFGPFMIGLLLPEFSKDIFHNLSGMPQWYVTSCIAIMFTVWGISVSADAINGIFAGLGEFFSEQRKTSVVKTIIKSGAADRKAFYEELRKIQGYVSDVDVKKYESIFDKVDKDNA